MAAIRTEPTTRSAPTIPVPKPPTPPMAPAPAPTIHAPAPPSAPSPTSTSTSAPTEVDQHHIPTRPSKFAATAAAAVALRAPAVPSTAIRERNLRSAATLWCRHLQFPTVRAVRDDLGMASAGAVLHGFHRLIDVHAAVIRTEWDLLEHGWFGADPDLRTRWLATHAVELAEVDPVLLRLPGLVCSAVFGSGAASRPVDAGLVVPLHALAALADVASGSIRDTFRGTLDEAVARVMLGMSAAKMGPVVEVVEAAPPPPAAEGRVRRPSGGP